MKVKMIVPDNKCATNAIFVSANYDSTIVIAEKTRY